MGFIKPSTYSFFREGKATRNLSFLDTLHGYIYGKWIYQYISIVTGSHPLAKLFFPVFLVYHKLAKLISGEQNLSLADTYHGKVVPLEGAKQLVTVNQPIRILDLEKIIPYKKARDIILCNPDHITVLDCPCRLAKASHCSPTDVCLVIGEPFASFMLEHHPERGRSINQEEALQLLEAEHKRGHVHHAFFKEATLNRFYAICNCCSCCCGAIKAMRNGNPMLASSGFVVTVDDELCVHCGRCVSYCQFDAIYKQEKRIYLDEAKCLGCGVCETVCTRGARSMVTAPERGTPLEVYTLIEKAAQYQRQ